LYAESNLTAAAAAGLQKKAQERDQLKPSERSPARRTMRAAADNTWVKNEMISIVSHGNNVQKAPYYDAENEKKKWDH